MSSVVSDEISNATGTKPAVAVKLVRITQRFSRNQYQSLVFKAIQALLQNYQAAAVGIDIDFSQGNYSDLRGSFTGWAKTHDDLTRRAVWAVGYKEDLTKGGSNEITTSAEAACATCSGLTCKIRYSPLPVFEDPLVVLNYGLSITFSL